MVFLSYKNFTWIKWLEWKPRRLQSLQETKCWCECDVLLVVLLNCLAPVKVCCLHLMIFLVKKNSLGCFYLTIFFGENSAGWLHLIIFWRRKIQFTAFIWRIFCRRKNHLTAFIWRFFWKKKNSSGTGLV